MSSAELDKHASRLKRRERIISNITSRLTPLRIILFIVGYAWLLLLPWKGLSRTAWIDENALQPGQVNVDWNWGDVKAADGYLEHLEALWNKNATSAERAGYIQQAFKDVGLETGSQQYSFVTPSGNTTGINAYALSRSSRSSGTEAIVIAASWISLQSETSPLTPKPSPLVTQPNLRGIATLLALARSLSVQHVWAKDLIFLVSDSYLDGAHAWLSAYHGAEQEGMHADALVHPEPAGVIWTAIVLDYPGHSFSHLGLFFEGTNGRLPNQDFANSASTISRSMGIPWVLYDHNDGDRLNLKGRGILISLLVELAEIFGLDVQDYWRRARNIVRNVGYQATGEPSGVHGVFHRYRIDAITLFALPARGPHGFHSLGRVVESLLRTSNNLLERLHASFFFYIFTAPGEFAEFAKYLPPVIILGLVASFGGLKLYVQTGWTRSRGAGNEEIWAVRDRPVLEVLCIMGLTHAAGLATLAIVNRAWFWQAIEVRLSLLPKQLTNHHLDLQRVGCD
ncbi:hypothetical protein M408DRAFT_212529 [Serendipita vermifera MAFF 305830]|uniref:Uncharacterized protein n=1 Tax=Serendipita vermifera MAFF 305830 TaxID=933852 RepID=A0A0C3B1B1_SERVB|nr:hypothetical protein M408DRAFT_212529 [Serendipita vermifera MAFF 305830]